MKRLRKLTVQILWLEEGSLGRSNVATTFRRHQPRLVKRTSTIRRKWLAELRLADPLMSLVFSLVRQRVISPSVHSRHGDVLIRMLGAQGRCSL